MARSVIDDRQVPVEDVLRAIGHGLMQRAAGAANATLKVGQGIESGIANGISTALNHPDQVQALIEDVARRSGQSVEKAAQTARDPATLQAILDHVQKGVGDIGASAGDAAKDAAGDPLGTALDIGSAPADLAMNLGNELLWKPVVATKDTVESGIEHLRDRSVRFNDPVSNARAFDLAGADLTAAPLHAASAIAGALPIGGAGLSLVKKAGVEMAPKVAAVLDAIKTGDKAYDATPIRDNAMKQGGLGVAAGATIGGLAGGAGSRKDASIDDILQNIESGAGKGAVFGGLGGAALGASGAALAPAYEAWAEGKPLATLAGDAAGHFPTGMAVGKILGGGGGAAYGALSNEHVDGHGPDSIDRLRRAALDGVIGFTAGGPIGGAVRSGAHVASETIPLASLARRGGAAAQDALPAAAADVVAAAPGKGAPKLLGLRTPEERDQWIQNALAEQERSSGDRSGVFGSDYTFKAPQDNIQVSVWAHPSEGGAAHIDFTTLDKSGEPTPFSAKGHATATQALQTMRRVAATIEADARAHGRPAYIMEGASQAHDDLYQTMAKVLKPPPGYEIQTVKSADGFDILKMVRTDGGSGPLPDAAVPQKFATDTPVKKVLKALPMLGAAGAAALPLADPQDADAQDADAQEAHDASGGHGKPPVPTPDPGHYIPPRYDDQGWVEKTYDAPPRGGASKGQDIAPVIAAVIGSLAGGKFGKVLGGGRALPEILGSAVGAGTMAGATAAVDPNDRHAAVMDAILAGIAGGARPLIAKAPGLAKAALDEQSKAGYGGVYNSTVRVPGGRIDAMQPFTPEDVIGAVKTKTGPNRYWTEQASPEQTYVNEVVADARARGAPVPSDVPITATPSVIRVPKEQPPAPDQFVDENGRKIGRVARASHEVIAMARNGVATPAGAQMIADQLGIEVPPGASAMTAVRNEIEGNPGGEKARTFRRLFPGIAIGALTAGASRDHGQR